MAARWVLRVNCLEAVGCVCEERSGSGEETGAGNYADDPGEALHG